MSYDGVLETSFGFGGKVSVNFAGANDYGYAMAAFTIDEQRLRTTVAFNYEAKNSYSIRVRSTDADASVRGCPCPGSRPWQHENRCRSRIRPRAGQTRGVACSSATISRSLERYFTVADGARLKYTRPSVCHRLPS